MSDCTNWPEKACRCPKSAEGFDPYHKWIPISYSKSAGNVSVQTLMCGICFHEVNITEAFQHRDCFKSKSE